MSRPTPPPEMPITDDAPACAGPAHPTPVTPACTLADETGLTVDELLGLQLALRRREAEAGKPASH